MNDDGDLLSGYEAIGAFLNLTPRQVKYRALTGAIPIFRMNRVPCATKAGLRSWLAKQMTQAEGATKRAS